MNERHRQLAHIAAGIAVVFAALFLGAQTTIALLIIALACGMTLATLKMLGFKISVFEHSLRKLERKQVMPFQGALMFVVGSLFALTFSPNLLFGLALISILGFGDGFATYFGIKGSHKVPWNPRKTWQGMLAFAIAGGIAAAPLIGLAAFGYSTILAFVESIEFGVDDNLTIPIAGVIIKLM
jgi:dolichol kinase